MKSLRKQLNGARADLEKKPKGHDEYLKEMDATKAIIENMLKMKMTRNKFENIPFSKKYPLCMRTTFKRLSRLRERALILLLLSFYSFSSNTSKDSTVNHDT